MSAAKHTPGPWRIATEPSGIRARHIKADSYLTVCSSLTSVSRNCGPDEINANARLIAAAPELLAALETAYMALIGYLPAHRNDVTDAAIGAARAAITKAKGGAA